MDIQTLTVWIRGRYEALKTGRDAGQSTLELAMMAGALLLAAGLVVVAVRTKLLEKIGIINGG
ncbi:hypothetical protein ACGFYP_33690 [Streptomyces sp. NPDC048370]|uniref:hypothetical protein n=1 Tax=Streptomyces sp. NPDC048370 TaxID=3365540 RepID=UPI00371B9785